MSITRTEIVAYVAIFIVGVLLVLLGLQMTEQLTEDAFSGYWFLSAEEYSYLATGWLNCATSLMSVTAVYFILKHVFKIEIIPPEPVTGAETQIQTSEWRRPLEEVIIDLAEQGELSEESLNVFSRKLDDGRELLTGPQRRKIRQRIRKIGS